MSPRPILKPSKADALRQPLYPQQQFRPPTHHEPHHSVHFPPSPSLTRTFLVHSASAYDRSSIIVAPNDCALPERGCPGRTYFDGSPSKPNPTQRALAMSTKSYHPRAFSSKSHPAFGSSVDSVPQLVPDISSESDESDVVSSLPCTPSASVTFGPHGLATPSSSPYKNNSLAIMHGYASCHHDAALAFLPYSPTSPAAMSYPYEDDTLHNEKPRRRRERKHEGTVDPDRIPSSEAQMTQFAHTFSSLSISATAYVGSPPRSPRKQTHGKKYSSTTPSFGFSTPIDDGCLGGF